MIGCSALLAGCTSASSEKPSSARSIGYRLLIDSTRHAPAAGQPSSTLETAVVGLLGRIKATTSVHIAWSAWPSRAIQEALLSESDGCPECKVQLVVDPTMLAADADSSQPIYGEVHQDTASGETRIHPQVSLHRPQGDFLDGKTGRMLSNFMLFRNIAPTATDNGDYGILFCAGPLGTQGDAQLLSEAIWVYGDSALYARFQGFWQTIVDGNSALLAAQTHTYSNLHDHFAWFFPDASAQQTSDDILVPLNVGLLETHQPTKVRWVLPAIDDCHQSFVAALHDLQERNEIDLRIVLPAAAYTPPKVVAELSRLPSGTLRLFPEPDSSQPWRLQSSFLLIDGPYSLTEGAPIGPHRLCFFFGGGWSLRAQQHSSGTWLRIDSPSLFEDLEGHFNALWKLSLSPADSKTYPPAKKSNCGD